jgi:hypothetical protein
MLATTLERAAARVPRPGDMLVLGLLEGENVKSGDLGS